MDRILRSDMGQGSNSANKRLSIEEDVTVLGGPPSKIVMFDTVMLMNRLLVGLALW